MATLSALSFRTGPIGEGEAISNFVWGATLGAPMEARLAKLSWGEEEHLKWALHYFKFKHITEIMPAHEMCDDEHTPQKQKFCGGVPRIGQNPSARRMFIRQAKVLFEAPNDFRVPVKSFKNATEQQNPVG